MNAPCTAFGQALQTHRPPSTRLQVVEQLHVPSQQELHVHFALFSTADKMKK